MAALEWVKALALAPAMREWPLGSTLMASSSVENSISVQTESELLNEGSVHGDVRCA